jgi:hypothetical protein
METQCKVTAGNFNLSLTLTLSQQYHLNSEYMQLCWRYLSHHAQRSM